MWPFTPNNPFQRPLHTLRAQYDYIVIGGGTGGCVVARRLAEDKKSTVLLIERGDAADSWFHWIPAISTHHLSDGKHSWVCDSVQDDRFGRNFTLICGSGLGGTSRINSCLYTCGVPAQYNTWSQQGRSGWSYDDFKPYLDKSEHWLGPPPNEYHGLNGPLQVKSFEGHFFGSCERAAEAIQRLGYHAITDMRSPLAPSVGSNKMQYTIDSDGRRSSSFRAYLPRPFVEGHENLHICANTVACKLEFSEENDGTVRAVGVELQPIHGRLTRTITARHEIVLTCGALRNPQLLMLSGIGPEQHLREMGIRMIKHSPGVGQHLQDHLLINTIYNCRMADSLYGIIKRPSILLREIFNYVRKGTGWLLGTLVEVETFGISSLVQPDGNLRPLSEERLDSYNPRNLPDFAIMFTAMADPRLPGVNKSKGTASINVGLMTARSSGQVSLRSLDPRADPLCEMRYLSAPEDVAVLRAGLRTAAAIAREMRTAGYPLEACIVPDTTSDTALDSFIWERVGTMYHYSSTCRMAPQEDEHPGVVDDSLRVHGIPNLRIADASIFPDVPAAHPQALVYAVAEKCADMIRREAGSL
ncbi:GMC oxidoreductase [Laetiporus sulphureus 93-53]|uniref:GMC oxidoreductase n=1 Tax=Laetiporus sulphureus 93-53 TaxID=1314785 RepID=A0A165D211_9APHY|nr:GMC oxidoreductase [Laetiporus sulphureus 93-53]KZT03996.1 GMC oxidoreductase [Laetiporus sulphureus 93-53]